MAKGRTRLQKITRQVKGLQRRGYRVPDAAALNQYLPTNYTIKDIYALSSYLDPISGKTITGLERLHQERSLAAKLAAQTHKRRAELEAQGIEPATEEDKTLEHIEQMLNSWQRKNEWKGTIKGGKQRDFGDLKEKDKDKLATFLSAAIAMYGREAVARRAARNADKINELVNQILYGGSGDKKDSSVENSTNTYMQAELNAVLEILKDGKLNQEEAEYFSDLAEAQLPYGENS